ncbi:MULTISPECIES: hypothetical protein [Variovorax]|uniref:Lipoprotein n=1 Tax=Variovorax boronicumulans TaxID=436515 RepID=A0AAW8DS57_9BURK|nr:MULTISPECIES: hypothetical protein [Variovorax]MDP9877101.1 hypothetical protein [Variovorax boronicumulans]MDP9922022.1 hypothetical protein [Variovorax boronicumulans]OEZ31863.1 hypothetical protein AO062_06495 [Variovorax boronicumulans]PBI91200.1 hypothetical protein BKP43_22570 [Variovorax boronicumulans]TSD55029.1 hypothetical protein FFI97_027165 [Variovorax sp. KBS0712]
MKRVIRLLLAAVAVSVFASGCAVNRATATVDPSANLDKLRVVQVRKLEGEDGTLQKLIAGNLRKRGFEVTEEAKPPEPVDAVVTYVDKWMWDITMYLVELTVTIREPKSDYPLATGNSLHTSLTRLSPPEMVDEVVGNIFKESDKTK